MIFALLSTFLIAAVYSSTAIHYVSAIKRAFGTFKYNSNGVNLQTSCWVVVNDERTEVLDSVCSTVSCGPKNNLCTYPTDINDNNREKVRNLEENNKDTKDSNSDVLKDDGILESNNNTSNDNVKEPKAPKLPEDLGGLIHEGR